MFPLPWRQRALTADSATASDGQNSRLLGQPQAQDGVDQPASLRFDRTQHNSPPTGFEQLLKPSRAAEKWLLVLFGVLALAFSIAPLVNEYRRIPNKDYDLWHLTGRIASAGAIIYPDNGKPFPFMYPPSCAAFLAVVSVVPKPLMVLGLLAVTTVSWLFCILASVYLATGRIRPAAPVLYLFPTLAIIPFVQDMYLLGQPVLLLLALLLGAFVCLRHQRQGAAGVLVAIAAGIKAYPVLVLGYLVYRRLWKAAAAMVVALALMLVVLPIPIRGTTQSWNDLTTWVRGMVLKYDSETIAQRPERSYSYKNQGLIALANRLLRPIPADGESKQPWSVGLADLDFRSVNAVILASSLALCGFYLVSMPRSRFRTPQSDAIEQAMLLILVISFNPLSFNYSYVWLIYPFTLTCGFLLQARPGSTERRTLLALNALPVLLLALAIPFLRGAQAYGNAFFAGLILFAGLGIELLRLARNPSLPLPENSAECGSLSQISQPRLPLTSRLDGPALERSARDV